MEIEETISEETSLPTDSESIVDRLRRRRREQAENTSHDLDLPGYNGELFCRYRLLDSAELDSIGAKVRQETRNRGDRVLYAAMDSLITSCEEIWVREGGREVPLREHETYEGPREIPVTYSLPDLAEYLGFLATLPDPPRARNVLLGVFGGNTIAIQAHSAMNAQWMMSAGAEVDMLLGEI